jgi:transcriptional regulator with XRE-family HTH domain
MKISNINKEIGGRIKIARISRNLSQDSIAEDLGISVSAYSNMERGVVDITVNRIISVSEILKIKWFYLLGIAGYTEMDFEKSLQVLADPREGYKSSTLTKKIDLEKEILNLKKEIGKLKQKK